MLNLIHFDYGNDDDDDDDGATILIDEFYFLSINKCVFFCLIQGCCFLLIFL